IAEAAAGLLPEGRLRLISLELGEQIISSHIAITAGEEYGYWLARFDERHAKLSPSLLGAPAVVRDAFTTGARRWDFGAGQFPYKRRFADGTDTQQHLRIVPRSTRAPLALAGLAPGQARRLARERLPWALTGPLRAAEERVAAQISGRSP